MQPEYAILKKPGFKILKGNGDNWIRVHTNQKAATPYMNKDIWFLNIYDADLAEYISLTLKINYWRPRQNHKDFNIDKYKTYNDARNRLISNNNSKIQELLIIDGRFDDLLAKNIVDIFIF